MEDFLDSITAALDAGEIDTIEASRRTIRYVQRQMGCDVVSYWTIGGEPSARSAKRVACADVDDPGADLVPMELPPDLCRACLDLIADGGIVWSSDALRDPRLAALREGYLVPAGIRSLLCVTIAVNDQPMSVIVCSMRHSPWAWTRSQVAQMRRLAAQISIRKAQRLSRHRAAAAMAEAMTLPPSF
ncbi:GAF domain-containing protein [Paucibacter sp. R3-3]|uniref:GAF domain-containing protein n=1 Tax=Roseateles agri TaxID=3098619 RepID=A0ABU5DBS1_9BURK|nr:GAF domain-containing protein [Paucibacter sp. R3-3]MDY0743726.1 GAF domain-containing protein [Paucibacter sp. R3-3]